MSYTKTQWVNNQAPALDADHLNHIEQGIKDAHDGLDEKADAADIPTKVSDLTNDADYQTGLQVQAALTAYKNVYRIDLPSFSSLPLTFSNSKITADHEIINSVLGTPTAQASDWTLTPTAGSATLSGSISGSTTLTLYIAEVESLTVT